MPLWPGAARGGAAVEPASRAGRLLHQQGRAAAGADRGRAGGPTPARQTETGQSAATKPLIARRGRAEQQDIDVLHDGAR